MHIMEYMYDNTQNMDNRILEKYIRGESSLEERIMVTEWAEADENNRRELLTLRKLFTSTLMNTVDDTRKRSRPVWNFKTVFRYAVCAVVASVVTLGTFALLIDKRDADGDFFARTISAPVGQRVHTLLSDGTEIWLNSNSTLQIFDDAGKFRRVKLDGEACFDVAHKDGKPFLVETEKNEVQVLGTTFNVTAYKSSEEFSVKLYEGKVEVKDLAHNHIVSLAPRQRLDFVGGKYVKSMIPELDTETWIEGVYYFEDETYLNILNKVQNYYNIHISIMDKDLADYRCTCKFRPEDGVEHLLNVLSEIHPFKYAWNVDRSGIIIEK